MQKTDKGFTLVEFLTVIAIIGLLSTVIISSINNAREDVRDSRRAADINQLKVALEMYFDSAQKYPSDAQGLAVLAPSYISVIPKDPLGSDYVYAAYLSSTIAVGNHCGAGGNCLYYHLGANFEGDNSTLRANDRDINGDAIDGEDADGCANEPGRWCYDLTP